MPFCSHSPWKLYIYIYIYVYRYIYIYTYIYVFVYICMYINYKNLVCMYTRSFSNYLLQWCYLTIKSSEQSNRKQFNRHKFFLNLLNMVFCYIFIFLIYELSYFYWGYISTLLNMKVVWVYRLLVNYYRFMNGYFVLFQ